MSSENENIVSNLSRRSLQLDDVIDDLGKYMSTENEESDSENKENSLMVSSDKENSFIDTTKEIDQDVSSSKSDDVYIGNISSKVDVDLSMEKLTEDEDSLSEKFMNKHDEESQSYENKKKESQSGIQLEDNDIKDVCDKEEVTKEESPCEEETKCIDNIDLKGAVDITNTEDNQENIHSEKNILPERSLSLDDANDDQKGEEESKSIDDRNDVSSEENQSHTFTDDENNNVDDIDRENGMDDTKENHESEKELEVKNDDKLSTDGFDVDEEEHTTEKDSNADIKNLDISDILITEEEALNDEHEVNSEESNDINQESQLNEISTEKDQQSSDHVEDQDAAEKLDQEVVNELHKEENSNKSLEIVDETDEKLDLSEENPHDNASEANVLQDEEISKDIKTKECELQTDVFVDSVSCCETKGEHTCERQVNNTIENDDLDDDIEALLANLDGLDLDHDDMANDLLNEFEPKAKDINEVKKYKFKICTSLASMDRHMVSRTNKIIAILLAQEEITEEHLELCDIGTDESYKKLWYRKAIDSVNRNALPLPGVFRENGAGNDDIFIGNFEMIYDYNEQFTIEEHLWPEFKHENNEEEESNNILMRLLGKKM